MIEVIKLKTEFYEQWLSPNGLALLGIGHSENDNGILFYAYFMLLCKEFDMINSLDKEHINFLLENLQEKQGLLNRRFKDKSLEAHDNYVGACAVALMSYNVDFLESVVDYGVKHGWNYNNVPPYEWRKESQRQGGEVAFYQICAGYTPDVFYFIWLLIGILISSTRWSSQVLLAWARVKCLKQTTKNTESKFVALGVGFISLAFDLIIKSRGGMTKFFYQYFQGDSVYGRLAKLVYG